MSNHPFSEWLDPQTTKVGRHSLLLLEEVEDERNEILKLLPDLIQTHYVDSDITAKRIASLGKPKTAKLLKEYLPHKKRSRSGDIGEIFATEIAEQHLNYDIPIKRLRWKDGRDMALRGDDLIGVARDTNGKLRLLKGESKSRVNLSASVINQAAKALDGDRGRPTSHSVLFVASRLREAGQDDLAEELEDAVLNSYKGIPIAQLLFVLTQRSPETLLNAHLAGIRRKTKVRHAVGLHITDHGKFIELVYAGVADG